MGVKPVLLQKLRAVQLSRTAAPTTAAYPSPTCSNKEVIVVPSHLGDAQRVAVGVLCASDNGTVDVIDLGAPRRLRTAPPRARALPHPTAPYTPNPRLYPGPAGAAPPQRGAEQGRRVRRERRFRRPVPNSRLYRPAPRRPAPPPPPPRPRAAWPPPAPPPLALRTASSAALRLLTARLAAPATAPSSRRLLVQLPTRGMDAVARHSASPDCSDGNEPSSAPSEFLAEFLSAIMRRQYAEALKYCRLILQYEPHNATARGFYPLLQHKLNNGNAEETSSTSEEAIPPLNLKNVANHSGGSIEGSRSGGSGEASKSGGSGETGEESSGEGEPWEESERSGASCSSLELDSSSPTERRGDTTRSDRSDHSNRSTDSAWSRWESSASRSERDDNGNAPAAPQSPHPPHLPHSPHAPHSPLALDPQCVYVEADIENDNAAAGTTTASPATPAIPAISASRATRATLKGGAATSLQRLRAQFACSTK